MLIISILAFLKLPVDTGTANANGYTAQTPTGVSTKLTPENLVYLQSVWKPYNGITVILHNNTTKKDQAITYTDKTGFYQFTKINRGTKGKPYTYSVIVNITGIKMDSMCVSTPLTKNQVFSNLDYLVNAAGNKIEETKQGYNISGKLTYDNPRNISNK